MEKLFVNKEIKYEGNQLSPHWIYRTFNLKGDAIVSFIGEVDVKLNEMVDIEDVINNEPIYSKSMVNFIIEHFNINLSEGVYRQRLFISIIKEVIESLSDNKICRYGDDLFVNNKKLSVSIATVSHNSVLIHTALNITSENTPIPTSNLKEDLNITDVKQFANEVMKRYTEEVKDIYYATCKVRGV